MSDPRKFKATDAIVGNAMNLLRWYLLTSLVVVLSACGFQLRGQSSLPPELESIQLIAENLNARQRALLEQKLRQAGASVQGPDRSATDRPELVRLRISFSSLNSRTIVNAAISGKKIVRLSRQLIYSLDRNNGDLAVEKGTLEQQQDIELDDNNLLDSEERISRAEESLDRDLIEQLIFSLKRL